MSTALLFLQFNSIANNQDMTKKTQTRRITQETIDESLRLKEYWEKRNPKTSQAEFSEKFEIGSQSAITQFLNGQVPLSMKAAMGFAEGLGIDVADFSPRLAKEMMKIAEAIPSGEDEYLAVKLLNVEVSAGGGASAVEIVEELGALHFRRSYMNEQGIGINNSAVINVRGESMEPTILDKAVVLINQNDTSLKNGNIYAFIHGHDLLIKRFFYEDGQWMARSDNKQFKDVLLNKDSTILGKAIWVGMSL